jgi:hypothetical protein
MSKTQETFEALQFNERIAPIMVHLGVAEGLQCLVHTEE